MQVFRRASMMEHVPCEGEVLTDAFLRKPQPGRERNAISCSQEYCTEGGMAQFIGFSLFMAWKRKGMDFAADVSRLSKGILNERLQVLISCVARWLVVHMY